MRTQASPTQDGWMVIGGSSSRTSSPHSRMRVNHPRAIEPSSNWSLVQPDIDGGMTLHASGKPQNLLVDGDLDALT